ncbi:protein DEHYDRATION-INDUCED 19 homolog 2-like isoform X3 [Ananas comosus]|uniref:Protein DEHYDRATION-INDUCED 19 homolog 2-like isoform X3 n=1 Tax=Ananas comosus TaxID=4615 RepID=A0A6P5EUR1_ANACO|nr:protein DEHYDRATION-INDUCED 19 homolog 2-like isoform X3 [Ananas comosus]
MEADSWSRLSAAASKRLLQSRYDLYLGFEEVDGEDDESRAEFNCPFCAEDFDFVGLCCHIDDEHHVEAKNGVCPICAERVGMDLVGHMTMQHGSYFKLQRRRRFRKASTGSHSLLSLLRKDLRDGNLQALLGGSSCTAAPSAVAPDPLLSSLVYNLPIEPSRPSPTRIRKREPEGVSSCRSSCFRQSSTTLYEGVLRVQQQQQKCFSGSR